MNRPLPLSTFALRQAARPRRFARLLQDSFGRRIVDVFLLTMMMPATFSFYVGPVFITPYRAYALVAFPALVFRLLRGRFKVEAPDLLILAFTVWTAACIVANFPEEQQSQRAGQFFLEAYVGYLFARASISSIDDIRRIVRQMFWISALAMVLAIPESVLHQHFIQNFGTKLTGVHAQLNDGPQNYRLGLLRAQAFFEHPILFGIFCAMCLSLTWYTARGLMRRLASAAVLAIATFFSLSSAPLLMFNVQVAMLIGERLSRGIKHRVALWLVGVGGMLALIQIVSNGGVFGVLINYLTFNRVSSYNRVLIWDWGWYNIFRHPLFGMIPENWERSPWMKVSIDNYWIYSGMLGGIPSIALLVAFIVLVFRKFAAVPLSRLPLEYRNFRRAWSLCMVAFCFTGFSVMFYGKLQPLFFFMLGMGAVADLIFRDQLRGSHVEQPIRLSQSRTAMYRQRLSRQ